VHTAAAPEDADAPGGGGDVAAALSASEGGTASYLRPTAWPTGGVLRVGLARRSGRFAGRSRWAVAPQTGLLNRPSGLAFSSDGTTAYVATFLPVQSQEGLPDEHPARGVRAFALPAGQKNGAWAPLPGFDPRAAPAAGVHPWGIALHPRTGVLLACAHGGAAGCVVAELCPASGRVRRIWRNAALAGGAPNALALL
jgi:hypothetical protein